MACMVIRPWRLAAFDVAIRTPLPSSLHPSVLWLFPSTPWRWHSRSCFTLHSRTLPFMPGPPILHRFLHNLPCLCLCRPITPPNHRSFRHHILGSTRFGPLKPPIPPWHIRFHLPHQALAQPVIYASTTLQRQVARPICRPVPPRQCDCAR
jgi:hypothetical protein